MYTIKEIKKSIGTEPVNEERKNIHKPVDAKGVQPKDVKKFLDDHEATDVSLLLEA